MLGIVRTSAVVVGVQQGEQSADGENVGILVRLHDDGQGNQLIGVMKVMVLKSSRGRESIYTFLGASTETCTRSAQ